MKFSTGFKKNLRAQRTLRAPVSVSGVGIHSGKPAHLTLKPASVNSGIRFVRVDLAGAPHVNADFRFVIDTRMATTLGRGSVTVSTVEHLMAALAGMGVDNVTIQVSGSEVPIMDGSSAPFAEAIARVGTIEQSGTRTVLAIRRRVEVRSGEKLAFVEPSSALEIHGSIEWDHPMIGKQEFHYIQGETDFLSISNARTFGFLKEVEALQKRGLALGGSLENAIVLDGERVLNPHGLRGPDEFVRHKVLDALGDLKLAGVEIQGYFRLHRAGHDMHSQLLNEIFKDPRNYEWIEGMIESDAEAPRSSYIRSLAAV